MEKETLRFNLFESIQEDLLSLHKAVKTLQSEIEVDQDHWRATRAMCKTAGVDIDVLAAADGSPEKVEIKLDMVELVRQSITQIPDNELLREWLQKNSSSGPRIARFCPSPP